MFLFKCPKFKKRLKKIVHILQDSRKLRYVRLKIKLIGSAWTLDKYGTNAHDAFFYVECVCNAWFTIELLIRQLQIFSFNQLKKKTLLKKNN